MNENVLLIGNPNSGKTTLFNLLTESNERTGNWHGVTVDKKEKLIANSNYNLIDLPGLYSINYYSFEEKITTDALIQGQEKLIVILDFNNLYRSLNLVLQLIEMNKNFVVILNPIKNKNNYINVNRLGKELHKSVLLLNLKKTTIENNVISCLDKMITTQDNVYLSYYSCFDFIVDVIKKQAEKINLNPYFCAIKLAEKNEEIIKLLNLDKKQEEIISEYISKNNLTISRINKMRFEFIDCLLKECEYTSSGVVGYNKLDRIFLNKFFSLVCFFSITALIFYLTFSSVGSYFSEQISQGLSYLTNIIFKPFLEKNFSIIFCDFLLNGILNSVGIILSFIPQIVLLYIFLAILEESGYISRIAFIFEDLFNILGLSGKSIFTFIMSLGCSTSAMLSARTLANMNIKAKTIMLSPYIICSAKIPLITILCAAFFKNNFTFFLLIYFISILIFLLVCVLLNKSNLYTRREDEYLDFPNYNLISSKKILYVTYANTTTFLSKVGSVLLVCLSLIWILNNFDFALRYVGNNKNLKSIIGFIGDIIVPIFKPIGLDNSSIISALISGLIAKEIIVGSLTSINGLEGDEFVNSLKDSMFPVNFSSASAVSFMIFSLFYSPCISSIVVMRNEIGGLKTLKSCLLQLVLTYCICFLVYNSILNIKFLMVILILFIFYIVFMLSYSYYKKNNHCNNCKKCKINCCKK